MPISVLESSLGPQTFEDIINMDLPELLEVRERYLAGLVEMNHLVRTLDHVQNYCTNTLCTA